MKSEICFTNSIHFFQGDSGRDRPQDHSRGARELQGSFKDGRRKSEVRLVFVHRRRAAGGHRFGVQCERRDKRTGAAETRGSERSGNQQKVHEAGEEVLQAHERKRSRLLQAVALRRVQRESRTSPVFRKKTRSTGPHRADRSGGPIGRTGKREEKKQVVDEIKLQRFSLITVYSFKISYFSFFNSS